MKILVTGGAGYIGSHTAHMLQSKGHEVVILDNLYSGHKWAVPKDVEFVEANIQDEVLLMKLFKKNKIDIVVHFAGYIEVEESVKRPLKYYENNVLGSLNLIKCCVKNNVEKFIFSSTAAVYGNTNQFPIKESAIKNPTCPYGSSKLMIENIIKDVVKENKNFSFLYLKIF